MNELRLRRPDRELADLVLPPGVHAVGRDVRGDMALVEAGQPMLAQLCIDRRGIWMQLAEGARGVHVNGRPVRRMAMLRPGDAIFLEGVELVLLGDEPEAAPDDDAPVDAESRLVLRGVGGPLHGRCHPLEQAVTIGRARDCEVRLDEPGLADRHARLVPCEQGAVLRDLGSEQGSRVNGHAVRHGVLRAGDQLAIEGCRFVLEAPRPAPRNAALAAPGRDPPVLSAEGPAPAGMVESARRLPWLLLAALLLSGALSLLLLYGTR
ncbi:FHA domain-containing protein [Lysobacter sp. A3-1-A15]|uniref:FHA domain-containing protein n=1 Tax=Novilysobacter viscosus TaxID=3098602 RepID=UPI002ED7B594